MNYVDFYGHKVSKLIVGDNPFNGHSYIPDYVNGQEMTDYCTEEKIHEAMFRMEELGINTMLPLADPYIIRILQHYGHKALLLAIVDIVILFYLMTQENNNCWVYNYT